ncbi:MAG: tetratricopeptide repeat protein [Candidatus Gastranaerophilales bacterium]|nr:tetratricopeptide repeat protein [Candidatus Gastranaerophilales bacterium]
MKKLLCFLTILFVGVFCSACINNYAVQQLNKMAKKYLDEGDLAAAAARLESSIDLDGNIYESRYNLASLYMDMGICDKALSQINEASKLIENEPAVYYIQATANVCLADRIYNAKMLDGSTKKIVYTNKKEAAEKAIDYVKYLTDANTAFNEYLKLATTTEETQDIATQISINNSNIQKISSVYKL